MVVHAGSLSSPVLEAEELWVQVQPVLQIKTMSQQTANKTATVTETKFRKKRSIYYCITFALCPKKLPFHSSPLSVFFACEMDIVTGKRSQLPHKLRTWVWISIFCENKAGHCVRTCTEEAEPQGSDVWWAWESLFQKANYRKIKNTPAVEL